MAGQTKRIKNTEVRVQAATQERRDRTNGDA